MRGSVTTTPSPHVHAAPPHDTRTVCVCGGTCSRSYGQLAQLISNTHTVATPTCSACRVRLGAPLYSYPLRRSSSRTRPAPAAPIVCASHCGRPASIDYDKGATVRRSARRTWPFHPSLPPFASPFCVALRTNLRAAAAGSAHRPCACPRVYLPLAKTLRRLARACLCSSYPPPHTLASKHAVFTPPRHFARPLTLGIPRVTIDEVGHQNTRECVQCSAVQRCGLGQATLWATQCNKDTFHQQARRRSCTVVYCARLEAAARSPE